MTEGLWVTVAFVILVSLAFKHVKKALLATIDSYSGDIQSTLDEANAIKAEANNNLRAAQEELANSKQVAADILARSKEEAEAIVQNAKNSAELEAKKQVDLLVSNFDARKKQMAADIKEEVVSAAIDYISDQLSSELEDSMSENAMLEASLEKFKHTKH